MTGGGREEVITKLSGTMQEHEGGPAMAQALLPKWRRGPWSLLKDKAYVWGKRFNMDKNV